MTAFDFIIDALLVSLVLLLPLFRWLNHRRPKAGVLIAQELEVTLHMAFVTARQSRYETISLEQLLLALLDNPRAADVLRTCTVDLEALRADVSQIVRNSTPIAPGTESVAPMASPEFHRVLQRAITRVMALRRSLAQRPGAPKGLPWLLAILRTSRRPRAVDGADLLVALLEESGVPALGVLQRHGVTRFAVTSAIAHGARVTDPGDIHPLQGGDATQVAIVLENDDFTPMEFVVEVLQEQLGLTRESAVRVMLQVHHDGRGIAGRFPADVATEKVERLRAAAFQAGHPIRGRLEAG